MDLYDLLDYATIIKYKKELKEKKLENPNMINIRIAVLCGSTLGEIKEFIELFLLYYGIRAIFFEGNYNRYYEEACFINNDLEDFSPDFVLLHMTNKNLLFYDNICKTNKQILKEEKERLTHIWKSLEEKYHCIVIQNNFEYFEYRMIGNAAKINENGSVKYIDDINYFISDYARQQKSFFVNDIHYLASYIGLMNWYDDRMWNLFKCPMAMSVMPRYALSIANIIKSILGKNKKTIITDLDNTLWGGVIGEIGKERIKLGKETPQGEAFLELHKYLKRLIKYGVLLNISSKNEYEIGVSGLQSTKSLLKEEDFLLKKIDWGNKPENISMILRELNILQESAIFIDDDLVECDSVEKMLPGIDVMQVTHISKLLKQMDTISYFEITEISNEDVKRQQLYKEEIARNEEKQKFETYEKYLESLKMVCKINVINDINIERVMQLFNKTNQFNFLTNRYTLKELEIICNKSELESVVLSLEDKFGDNGIVAIAIIEFKGEEAHIRDWVMSCRVFERGLEYEMLKQICHKCYERKATVLYGYYQKTEKNKKIACFYEKMQFVKDDKMDRWRCSNIEDLLARIRAKTDHIKEIIDC